MSDYPEFSRESYIKKSRATHKCCECYRKIEVGEPYSRLTGKWGFTISSYATCNECGDLYRYLYLEYNYQRSMQEMFSTIEDVDYWRSYNVMKRVIIISKKSRLVAERLKEIKNCMAEGWDW
jgi:hypothetical protein